MLLEVERTLSLKQNDFRYRKIFLERIRYEFFNLLNKESSDCLTHNKLYCKALHLDL